MIREEILKGESYVVDCYIHISDADRDSKKALFTDKGDGIVRARLKNYAIIPMDVYEKLKTKQIDLEIERLKMLKNRNELTGTGIELLDELISVKKQLNIITK